MTMRLVSPAPAVQRGKLGSTFRLFCTVLPLLACGAPSSDAARDVTVLPRLVATEELRIGSVHDATIGFSDIGGVGVDSEGLTYVLERQDRTIRVYDPQGQLLRTIGGRGEGPGEFERPIVMGLIRDTIWVNDFALRRLTFFARQGNVTRILNPRPTAVTTLPGLDVQLTVGTPRADGLITSGWSVPIPPNPPADSFFIPIVRMDSTGAVIDTIRLQPWSLGKRELITVGGRQVPVPQSPSDGPLFVETEDGAYVVQRSTRPASDRGVFAVARVTGMADTLFYRAFRYSPRPYDRATIDSMVRPRAASYAQATGVDTDAVAAALEQAMTWPAHLPPVSAGRVGLDTVLWLRREDTTDPTHTWILISPRGDAIGQLQFDRGATVLWSAGNQCWVSLRDEFDVPWLVRYRLDGFR